MNEQKLNFKVKDGCSKIDGRGCFANERIEAKRKLGELSGDVVSVRVGRRNAKNKLRVHLVEFGDGFALDATNGNELKYLNSSCVPNAYIRIVDRHVEVYSLKEIDKGEEITVTYGDTHHDGKLKCKCGNPKCKRML